MGSPNIADCFSAVNASSLSPVNPISWGATNRIPGFWDGPIRDQSLYVV
jgi:hypothetical protein